ncbi:MAG: hypothetical protein NHB15_08610 [Methanosarcina barkeri]|nr:hypothetical protein [Methanosarcina sp. ERenArc_MAG2]
MKKWNKETSESMFLQKQNKSYSEIYFLKSKRRKYFTVWFNCWRYEKEDELWSAFALNFIAELSKNFLGTTK